MRASILTAAAVAAFMALPTVASAEGEGTLAGAGVGAAAGAVVGGPIGAVIGGAIGAAAGASAEAQSRPPEPMPVEPEATGTIRERQCVRTASGVQCTEREIRR